MADPHYILEENPVYDEAIRALQDSDPARASTTFNPVLLGMLNNTHHVKKALDAHDKADTAAHTELQTAVSAAQTALETHKADRNTHVTTAEKAAWTAKETPAGAQAKADVVQGSLNTHTANGTIHVSASEKAAWDAKETPDGAQAKVEAVQANLNVHSGNSTHASSAEKSAWNAKETPAGAQAKADAVRASLTTHTSDKNNPHGSTAEQIGAANVSLSNVANESFKSKAESAGAAGQKIFDQVIRTQEEFNALIASPTWLGAVSVCFIGDGGTLKFSRDGQGIKIPQTVKQIQGLNSATIEVTNYPYSVTTAAMYYETLPTSREYWMRGIHVKCSGKSSTFTLRNCTNLTNCISSAKDYGYNNCTFLANCTSFDGVYAFYKCSYLTNCTSTTSGFSDCSYLTNCTSILNMGYSCFSSCSYLTNCTGVQNSGSSSGNSCFWACRYLTNCISTLKGYSESAAFNSCYYLTNCIGTTSVTSSYSCRAIGFSDCSYLTNCTGTGTGSGGNVSLLVHGTGFMSCTQLTNCTASGTVKEGSTGAGYGFLSCNYLNGCKQGDIASTTGFLGGTNTKVDTATVVAS